MRVLVIGGTGTVGSRVARGLVARGADARVPTRSPAEHAEKGIEYVQGDLEDVGSISAALEGVERVCLVTPLHPQEETLGVRAVGAIADAGVERLVYQSVHDVRSIPDPPHLASKIRIEEEIRVTGLPHAVVAPNNFFQNDLWLREPIVEHGIYPSPLGTTGLSRVDVGDIAAAAVRALLDLEADGSTWPIVGPDVMTGPSTAEAWSEALGRDVRYAGDDLDAWAESAASTMPGWLIDDLCGMFAGFQERGLVASDEDLARCREILGREPRPFDDFAAETAAAWTA